MPACLLQKRHPFSCTSIVFTHLCLSKKAFAEWPLLEVLVQVWPPECFDWKTVSEKSCRKYRLNCAKLSLGLAFDLAFHAWMILIT